jgi:uncharacterized protein (TIGR00369 family)
VHLVNVASLISRRPVKGKDLIEGNIPEGFFANERNSPLTDPWEPIYVRRTDESLNIGLWLREEHCNARGFAHGGLISALADNSMGHTCLTAYEMKTSLVTVNLAIDFIGIVKIGAWLEFNSETVKAGKSLAFAQCMVTADGKLCARGHSTFKVV